MLTAEDYWTLASWYQAQNRRADYQQAKVDALAQLPESALSYAIREAAESQQGYGSKPQKSELGELTLLALKALMEKSQHASYYVSELGQLYTATRDFRLLQMTPDALLGRTRQDVYAMLEQFQTSLLRQMKDEAAADEILARIEQLRADDRTALDRRALDLYEVLVERRSSQLKNQSAPHADACLAALRRAERHQWSEGEPQWMARLLTQLGTMPTPELRDEQLRQLGELQDAVPAGSRGQLLITADLCRVAVSEMTEAAG